MFEEVDRRIKQLQRSDWRWVKRNPQRTHEMCAVVDARTRVSVGCNQLSDETLDRLNKWLDDTKLLPCSHYGDDHFHSIIEWNDANVSYGGAASVEEVITVLEKFRAEL